MSLLSLQPSSRHYAIRQLRFSDAGDEGDTQRAVPIEAPIAIEVCGIKYAVMMATPSDLREYAVGFALSERLVQRADQIRNIDILSANGGWVVQILLPSELTATVCTRARTRVSESSCGLCGLESIEQILRPLPPVTARIQTDRAAIAQALSTLEDHQPLGRATGAVHAAAMCAPDGRILLAREDVGRHNALDKLIGALALKGIDPSSGFFVLSARCSYELVEKTVRAGCPMLVTVSAPTSLAIDRATKAGLTLVALARPDSAMILCDALGNIA
ncbi:MAG: formate dehydrogenase accessory sulfurtransferase FdhD [Nitrospira sp.]|nr:formate dehydrogenase accessory sulfurtransferase FdhD [Nitrospira sp.]